MATKGDADRVSDSYWERQSDGTVKHVVVFSYCPRLDERYIPDTEFNEALGEFFRWKFSDQPAKDSRWARDYYRSKGAIVTKARRKDDGKLIRVYTIPPQSIE
jgi:hypothetical protein